MALELRGVRWFVDKEFDFAIEDLVNAAVGENMPRTWYSGNDRVCEAARNMAEAYQAGQAVYKDGHWLVDENFQEAITALVFAVRENPPCGPYSDQVYEAARNVAEAYQAGLAKAFYFYTLTDIAEYKAELDRHRQIGLTIDPATAETTFGGRTATIPTGSSTWSITGVMRSGASILRAIPAPVTMSGFTSTTCP